MVEAAPTEGGERRKALAIYITRKWYQEFRDREQDEEAVRKWLGCHAPVAAEESPSEQVARPAYLGR